MNLENLGLVELSAQEVQEVDGGWIIAAIIIAVCVCIVASSIHDSNNGVYQQGQP